MNSNRKGQAALDFLMTYGWAIALVVIIAAVLFALGIFDVSNFVGNKASGFSGVAVAGWQLGTGANSTMSLKLSNQVGQRIQLQNISVTVGTSSAPVSSGLPLELSTGESTGTLLTDSLGTFTSGAGYTAKVVISYTDMNSGFQGISTGTLTGKAA